MNKLVKLAIGIIGVDLVATSVVAAQNAVEENRQTENKHHKGFYEKYIKRPTDFFLASGAFIVLSPVLAGTAVAVRTKLGSPVLFTQDRPGKNEKIFKLYKFRTMTDEIDENGELLPDEKRLTKFGKLLRSTSLDELPELINIIKGDMAIIGPRPLIVSYLPYYTEEEHHRHDVRPGLSGLAQARGRSFLCWEKIFEYDLQYVRHISFLVDCKVVIMTIKNILFKQDVVDFSEVYVGEDGNKHIKIGSEELTIHRPLDEERSS